MRVRITFSKTEAMRFTGTIDLHRTLERIMRRARLPVRYSQGFTPRPKLNLANPLPLGYTGEVEMAEFWLDETLPLEEIAARFREASSPGVVLHGLEPVDEGQPKLQTLVKSVEYLVTLLDPPPEDIRGRVAALLQAQALPRARRGKPYDLRPLVLRLALVAETPDGCARLQMELLAQEGATGRPDEVLRQLGVDPLAIRCTRTAIHFKSSEE